MSRRCCSPRLYSAKALLAVALLVSFGASLPELAPVQRNHSAAVLLHSSLQPGSFILGDSGPATSNTKCTTTCTVGSNGTYVCVGCKNACDAACIGGICAGVVAVFAIILYGVFRHHARQRALAIHQQAAHRQVEHTMSMTSLSQPAPAHHLKHCGRMLPQPPIPGSDGRCSALNGQCPACMHAETMATSDSGAARAAYAAAFLGVPPSDFPEHRPSSPFFDVMPQAYGHGSDVPHHAQAAENHEHTHGAPLAAPHAVMAPHFRHHRPAVEHHEYGLDPERVHHSPAAEK